MSTSTMGRFRLPDGTFPAIAGADPVTDPPAELMPRIRELNQQIAQTRTQASTAWANFDRLRGELAGSPHATDQDSPQFKAAEEASQAYSELAERVSALEETRERLMTMGAIDAPTGAANGNGPQDGDGNRRPTVADTLLAAVRGSAGHMALQSEGYKRLQQRNAFTQEGRKSIDEVLIQSGGEAGREQLRQALRGVSPAAALVTGTDQTSGGALVSNDRLPGITVPLRTRPLRLLDLITVGDTDSDTVEYVEMTGFTNAAAETAEAIAATGTSGTKPESAIALAQRTINVQTIAHWIPATKRALADAGQLRTLIDGILQLGLDLRVDQQIVTGDGVGSNLRGIRNTVGIGSVTVRLAVAGNTNTPETILDTIHRAITVVRLAFFEPTAIGIHPADYERVRLARAGKAAVANTGTTAGSYAEGDYLMGAPDQPGAERIWGLLPVVSAAFTEGRPVIGDYRQAVLWLREGTQVLASDSHMDFFVRNLVAILAEFRAAFGVLAPPAFCEAVLV
jgi:HK97 family phage major capsid protein